MPIQPPIDVTLMDINRLVCSALYDNDIQFTTTETASNFCLLWNLYERELYGKECNNIKLAERFTVEFNPTTDKPSIIITNSVLVEALGYFKGRYIDNYNLGTVYSSADFNDRFNKLHPSHDDETRKKMKRSIRYISDGLLNTTDEKLQSVALLAILYRFRNNLFHGGKMIERLNEQRENLIVANNVLFNVVQNHYGNNGR